MCRLALSSHPLGSQLYRLMWHCWKGGAHYSVNTSNAVNLHSGAKQKSNIQSYCAALELSGNFSDMVHGPKKEGDMSHG